MFVGEGKRSYIPNCYGCGKECVGGYKLCKNITDFHFHRSKVVKHDVEGVFRKKSDHNVSKRRTVRMAAGDGDSDSDNNGDEPTMTTSSTPSTLTNNQSSYAQFLVIAKLAVVVNASVGVAKEDEGINGICGDDIRWDGCILAGMELEFLQVQHFEAERYLPLNKELKVQSRRRTNPVRGKTKSIKDPKTPSPLLRRAELYLRRVALREIRKKRSSLRFTAQIS